MRKSMFTLATLVFLSTIGLSQEPTRPVAPPAADAPKATEGSDAAVDAWMKMLTEKIAAENPTIRRSVQAAVLSVGAPAIPHLKKVAAGEGEAAGEAQRLITRIERGPQNRGPNEGGRPGVGRGQGMERMFEGLGLNAEQTAKITAITEKRTAKMGEMREKLMNGEMTREEFGEAMRNSQGELEKELSGVLTEEQLKQFREMSESMRGRFGGAGGAGPGGRGQRGEGGQPGRRRGRGQIED